MDIKRNRPAMGTDGIPFRAAVASNEFGTVEVDERLLELVGDPEAYIRKELDALPRDPQPDSSLAELRE